MQNLRNPLVSRNTPALDLWRRELAAGLRTPETFDPLWRAACAELNALEAVGAGLPETAAGYHAEARQIIARAALGRVA